MKHAFKKLADQIVNINKLDADFRQAFLLKSRQSTDERDKIRESSKYIAANNL